MKKGLFLALLFLLLEIDVQAARQLVIFNPVPDIITGSTRPTQIFLNDGFDSSDYSGCTNCDFDPDVSLATAATKNHWKRQSDRVWITMTAAEIAKIDAYEVALATANDVSNALVTIQTDPILSKAFMSVVNILVSEIQFAIPISTLTRNNVKQKIAREINPP